MKTVSVWELKEGMVLAGNVYAQDDSVIPVLTENTVITKHLIKKLKQNRIFEVPIAGESEPHAFFVPKPEPIISEELRIDAVSNLEEFFHLAQFKEDDFYITSAIQVVKHLDTVVDQLVETLSGDQDALVNINDLKSYDEYTYHHSLSVAVLTIAIAATMGFDKEDVSKFGRSAILHDIGKTAIPIEIIQKPSRLDNKEFAIIKTHSSEGYQYLIKGDIGDEELWNGVLCHHEKVDGTGYPFGFKKPDIPLVSRIISVADVYDALTSNRPYRTPMLPQEAIDYIMAGVDSAFDYDVVMAFLEKLELYPVGSFIELSNRKIAVVLNNENAMRPVVKMVDTGEVLDLYHDLRCLSLVITKVLPDDILLRRANAAC